MKARTRRAVAFVAALISRKSASSIYDHADGRHYVFSGECEDGDVNAIDHETSSAIVGSDGTFHHHGNNAAFLIEFQNREFSGYDHDSNGSFVGQVGGSGITLYDNAVGKNFSYSVG